MLCPECNKKISLVIIELASFVVPINDDCEALYISKSDSRIDAVLCPECEADISGSLDLRVIG